MLYILFCPLFLSFHANEGSWQLVDCMWCVKYINIIINVIIILMPFSSKRLNLWCTNSCKSYKVSNISVYAIGCHCSWCISVTCHDASFHRNRLRMYPAFVNCTTIDWFTEWPKEALVEVAEKYLETVDLGDNEEVSVNLVLFCFVLFYF